MPIANTSIIASFFHSTYFLVVIKIAILLILLFYAIFALIIVKQVSLMAKTFVTNTSTVFGVFATANLLFAVALIVLAAGVL